MARIAGIFLAGILGLLPLVVTAAVIGWVVSFAYDYLGPESWFGKVLISIGGSTTANVVPNAQAAFRRPPPRLSKAVLRPHARKIN